MPTPVLDQLTDIIRDVMDNPGLTITEATTAKDVEEWDSLSHVLLMASVEKKFGVKFTAVEIQRLQNVGDLMALIHARLAS